MNSDTENEAAAENEAEAENEPELNNTSDDVSMFSETNSESTKGEVGALVELMEEQIYDQNIQIQELKKQIEYLKSILISQLPDYLNAVLKFV